MKPLKGPSLEVVLPAAELTELPPEALVPAVFRAYGRMAAPETATTFRGEMVVKIEKGGYKEAYERPECAARCLAAAIGEAVQQGKLWLSSDQASILAEEIPAGILTDDARLQAPASPIPATDLIPASLPEVWSADSTTALAIAVALSKKAGSNLPWATVRNAIDGAIHSR